MSETVREIYDRYNSDNGPLDQLQQQYQIFNGNGQSDFNAAAHAYTSAGISYHHGETWATIYGEGREAQTRVSILFEGRLPTDNELRDGLRDVFNNRVGIEVAQYARDNNLPESVMADLVGDALARGVLIVNEFQDSRILDPGAGTQLGIADVVYDGPSTDAARAIELSYGLPTGSLTTGNATGEGDRTYFNPPLTSIPPRPRPDMVIDQCFLAGTPITMWPTDSSLKPGIDGVYDQAAVRASLWVKPIDQVSPKDLVVSYDDNGNMVPGFVPQTMTNFSKIIFDFHGTWVTPGHVYWCVDGKYSNQYAPLIDILRTDGAVEHQSGTKIRASTGCEVGSLEDELVTMAPLVNGQPDGNQARKIRLGTRLIRHDATEVTVMDGAVGALGPIDKNRRFPNGQHVSQAKVGFHQEGPMPNPEDYVLIRSQTTLEEIYQANQWEAMRPQMPAPMVLESGPVQPLPADKVEQMKRNTPMAMLGLGQGGSPMAQKTLAGPGGKSPMNRKARKAAEAKQRKAARGRKQVVH